MYFGKKTSVGRAYRQIVERRREVERAQHQVDRARRRCASVEPKNRLVARTLERDWEEALSEQVRLLAHHEHFQREAGRSA